MARRRRLTDKSWDRYKRIVNDFVDEDAGKQPLLWLKRFDQILSFGEDSTDGYTPIELDVLVQYNYIRTWPSQKQTVTGSLDGINIVIYITKRQLEEKGYLTPDGYWDFDWVQDRFIINGKVYAPEGDTQVAQAHEEALLFFVVLERENPEDTKRILAYVENLPRYLELSKEVVYLTKANSYKDTVEITTNTSFNILPDD